MLPPGSLRASSHSVCHIHHGLIAKVFPSRVKRVLKVCEERYVLISLLALGAVAGARTHTIAVNTARWPKVKLLRVKKIMKDLGMVEPAPQHRKAEE